MNLEIRGNEAHASIFERLILLGEAEAGLAAFLCYKTPIPPQRRRRFWPAAPVPFRDGTIRNRNREELCHDEVDVAMADG